LSVSFRHLAAGIGSVQREAARRRGYPTLEPD
jgi:hypothetical protein